MWWIIIGAVVALVVMIVLMMLFTGKSNKLEIGLMDCAGKGGECLAVNECKDTKDVEATISRAFDCPTDTGTQSITGNICCFKDAKTTNLNK